MPRRRTAAAAASGTRSATGEFAASVGFDGIWVVEHHFHLAW